MSLSSIVNLSITRDTKAISQAGFGKLLILGCHTVFPERAREYSDPSAMLDDGFTTSHPIYKKALIHFSQEPHPPTFVVGRRANLPTWKVKLTPKNVVEGFKYEFNVMSPTGTTTAISTTNGASTSVAAICAQLQTPLNAISGLTAVDNGTDVEVTADTAGAVWLLTGIIGHRHLGIEVTHTAPNIAADLAAVREDSDDWYGWCLDTNSEAEILAAAAANEAIRRIFFAVTPDNGVPDSSDTGCIASQLVAAAYDRTVLTYYGKASDGMLDAGWPGRCFPTGPGRITWAYKAVKGVAVDNLTDGEIINIHNKNCATHTEQAGVNVMQQGKVASGEWIDVIRLVDLIYARIQETLFGALVNNDKIPYTQAGINQVYAGIDSVLSAETASEANPLGGLSSYTISVPAIAGVPSADKIARALKNVTFQAYLSGAIHTMVINGRVSV